MKKFVWLLVFIVGCDAGSKQAAQPGSAASGNVAATAKGRSTLAEARQGFVTKIVKEDEPAGPPDKPTEGPLELIRYQSPVGMLAAYLTKDPGDGKKHPAIVWVTGGDTNSIGDVWTPAARSNDQSASAFRKAGIVMMFPSQRGGNDNPGKREGFYGEVEDVLAATDHLAKLPYVDPKQIYLGGHSTGGTLVMLIGEYSNRYRGVISLGPVAAPSQYGGAFLYCDLKDKEEIKLRSPYFWLNDVQMPMYVFEGADGGNWEAIQMMVELNTNPKIKFFKIPGHTHFSVIAPLVERLAAQIAGGSLNVTEETVSDLK